MDEIDRCNGGSFLLHDPIPADVFTPEDFTPEQLLIAKTAREFVENEVLPVQDRIEEKDLDLLVTLVRKAGDLGLLMADVPEEYGGLSLDKATSALIAESLAGLSSFMMTCNGHAGIGTLPIVYYGTAEQKAKYLPGLRDGSKIGCYCLTEPSAGSDALASRTRAVLSDDKTHYILNGTKQFITNGAFADVFTVFAKVDGKDFTAFIVDRDTPGLSIGPEEHKMGRRGSSTTTVFLEDARVPVENVLGEIGQGHKIAFNILNIGRFKVAAQSVGAAKHAFAQALAYSLERRQFGKRLADMGMIREKLAHMFVDIYTSESATYRTVGLIDRLLATNSGAEKVDGQRALRSVEEYNVECAILKVLATEMLDEVVDEAVQCYGGYGYCCDYPVERGYRDSRVGRIYEGTNEINRVFLSNMILRRASRGFPLNQTAEALEHDLSVDDSTPSLHEAKALAYACWAVLFLKKVTRLAYTEAMRAVGGAMAGNQMILGRLADLAITTYAAEATTLRALKDIGRRGEDRAVLAASAATIACEEALDRAEALARQVLVATQSEDAVAVLRRLPRPFPVDTLAARETIASRLVEAERWIV